MKMLMFEVKVIARRHRRDIFCWANLGRERTGKAWFELTNQKEGPWIVMLYQGYATCLCSEVGMVAGITSWAQVNFVQN